MSDCLNDRLGVTFDDQEVTEMRKINRSDVLMAYQEKNMVAMEQIMMNVDLITL